MQLNLNPVTARQAVKNNSRKACVRQSIGMVEYLELPPMLAAGRSPSTTSATPDALAYCFLIDGEVEGPRLTYSQLDRCAAAWPVRLRVSPSQATSTLAL